MPFAQDPAAVHALAVLAFALAHGADRNLTPAELSEITDRLHVRCEGWTYADVHMAVMEALGAYSAGRGAEEAASRIVAALPEDARHRALADLADVARADGVVLPEERAFVLRLAERWRVAPPELDRPRPTAGPLADLAYLCVALAYGTDADLSDSEADVIHLKLADWADALGVSDAPDEALDAARARFAAGPDRGALHASIRRAARALPAAFRAVVLRDMVQIANADGRFLDTEEDLLNTVSAAWGV